MYLDGVVYSKIEPKNRKVLWLRPVANGVSLYICDSGWRPLRLINDMDTFTVEDDNVIDVESMDSTYKAMYYEDLYIGAGLTLQDILIPSNHFSVLKKGTSFSYSNLDGESLFIVMSSSDTPEPLMASLDVPVQKGDDIIVNGRVYHVWQSSNAYQGDIRIILT